MKLRLLSTFALILSITSEVAAFEISDSSWPNANLSIDVQLTRPANDPQQWNNAFQVAVDRWNTATDAFTINMNANVFKNPCDDPNNDPIGNGSTFGADQCGEAFGESTLAVTILWSIPPTYVQAGILFNSTRTWDIYDTGHTPFSVDLTRVAVHELGHAMGLLHEETEVAIMAPAVGDIILPTADDLAGVAAIYGLPSADLSISQTPMDEVVVFGDDTTVEIGISNEGPQDTDDVVIDIIYDESVLSITDVSSLFSGSEPEPSCAPISGGQRCTYDTLANLDTRTVEAAFETTGAGPFTITSTVSSSLDDANSANDSASDSGEVVASPDDFDSDTITNDQDNCPYVANPGQEDGDLDGVGDACVTSDIDDDGSFDHLDNCPVDANANQADEDVDGIGNVCDLFNTGSLGVVPTSSATFTGSDADSGSQFTLQLTNASSLLASIVEYRASSLWPNAPQAVELTTITDPGQLGGDGALDTSESLSITETLSSDELAPIVLGFDVQDPESLVTRTLLVGFQNDGTILIDSDGDAIADEDDAFVYDAAEQIDTDYDGIGNNADTDDDGDGLSDTDEANAGTDPLNPDTDGDSMWDGQEVLEGLDPLDPSDCPETFCNPDSFVPNVLIPILEGN